MLNTFKLVSLIVTLILILPSAVFSQANSTELEEGQKIFPLIDSKTEQLFLEAARQGKVYDPPDEVQIYPAENQLSDVWAGNKPILNASISDIKLHWKLVTENSESVSSVGESPISFTTDLTFNKDSFIIIHSRPYFPNQYGGIRVPLEPNGKARRFWYRGRDGTSLLVVVPRFHAKERDRGVLLCPRDFLNQGSRNEKASLRAMNLIIEDANYKVDGEVRGQLRNAVDMGLARAMIMVSPRVIPSTPYIDEIYSKVSNVAVFYKAAHQQFKRRVFDFSNLADGIEVGIEMHLPTGFKRYSRYRDLVYIKRIDEPVGSLRLQVLDTRGTPLYAEAQQRGIKLKEQVLIDAKVEEGGCYLVLNDRGVIIHDYLKTPFSLPEKFREEKVLDEGNRLITEESDSPSGSDS